MKRFTLLFLCACMLCSCVASLRIGASDQVRTDSDVEEILNYTCTYNPKAMTVELSGTTNHSTIVSNSNAMLEVYTLLPGEKIGDLWNNGERMPVAKSEISIKFHFSIRIERISEKYAQYAIFLRSSDGGLRLAAEPQYPIVSSAEGQDVSQNRYKGISIPLNYNGGSGFMPGTTVIPLYINEVIKRDTNGYLYYNLDTSYYFDTAIVNALDIKIRSASALGSRVYIQFLLPAVGSELAYDNGSAANAFYDLPNVISESVLRDIEALTGFLVSRYNGRTSGRVTGIIVGKSLDRADQYQYAGNIAAADYVDLYMLYVIAVSNSARIYDPSCEIILPFSDQNPRANTSVPFSSGEIMRMLLQKMEDSFSSPFLIKTLVEINETPFGITNENVTSGIDLSQTGESDVISVHNFDEYTDYLSNLKKRYTYAPESCIAVWAPSSELSGTALECAYAYSYFKLLSENIVSSFVISCSDPMIQLSDLTPILSRMDTEGAQTATSDLLQYFGVKSWNDLMTFEQESMRVVYNVKASDGIFGSPIGSFVYADYSASVEVENWYVGENCAKIKSEYHNEFARAIRMNMVQGEENRARYAEAFCLYEYGETFRHTPFLSLQLLCDSEKEEGLYEVCVTVGNEDAYFEASHIVSEGAQKQIVLDLQEVGQEFRASFVRIRVRALTADVGTYSLWLGNITGYSHQYDDEQLTDLIRRERQMIRNEAQQGEASNEMRYVWIVFSVLLITGSVAVGVFVWLRREENEWDKE